MQHGKMNIMKQIGLALLVLVLASLVGCDNGEETRSPVAWRVGTAHGTEEPLSSQGFAALQATLVQVSGGRIKLTPLPPEEGLRPDEVLAAVGSKKVDAAWSTPEAQADAVPAAQIYAGLPFGADHPELLGWVYKGGGLELWRELYGAKGVVPVPCGMVPSRAAGWFRQPIGDLAQFQGMRMHMTGLGRR